MTLQNRINELFADYETAHQRKLKNVQLAKYAHVSRATITDWRNGKTKKIEGDNAFEVAKFFGVSAEWVQTGHSKKLLGKHDKHVMERPNNNQYQINPAKSAAGSSSRVELPAASVVPLLSLDQAKQWRQSLADYTPDIDNGMIKLSDIPTHEHSFVVEIIGDAMTPKFPAGMRVLIDPDRHPEIGHYVLVDIAGDVVARQLWREAGDVLLKPLNPQYRNKLATDGKIIGVITWKIPKPIALV